MLRRAALIVAMIGMLTSPAWTEDSPEGDAKATPPGVSRVFSGGFWSDGKDEGHYRIVVVSDGFEHVSHRVFIQWIAIDQVNHELKIKRTIPIEEISELSGVVSDIRPQFKPGEPLRFTVTLTGRDGKTRRRAVTATPNGYTIK